MKTIHLGDGRVMRRTGSSVLVKLDSGEHHWLEHSDLAEASITHAGQIGAVHVHAHVLAKTRARAAKERAEGVEDHRTHALASLLDRRAK